MHKVIDIELNRLNHLKLEQKSSYILINKMVPYLKRKTILDRVNDGLFEYETDGLIFTPADKGGSDKVGRIIVLFKERIFIKDY